jgi:hypothetical protein
MNTKKQDQKKNQRQKTQRQQGSKKQGQHMLHDGLTHHEQESPETRLTR